VQGRTSALTALQREIKHARVNEMALSSLSKCIQHILNRVVKPQLVGDVGYQQEGHKRQYKPPKILGPMID
jgi:hypothetical protein